MDTERKRRVIINVVFYGLLFVLFYYFLKYAFWLFFPIVFSFIIALMLQPGVNAISKRTPIKRSLASIICLLLLVVTIGGIIFLIGASVVNYLKGFSDYIKDLFTNTSKLVEDIHTWVLSKAHQLPESLSQKAIPSIEDFFSKIDTSTNAATAQSTVNAVASSSKGLKLDFASISKWITTPVTGLISTALQIPSMLLTGVITIVMTCFLTADFDKVSAFLASQMSEKHQKDFARAKHLLKTSFRKVLRAYGLIIIVTFVEMLIGLSVLKLIGVYRYPYVVIIAAATAIVDIFPVLGTGTVIFPWAVYSLITGNGGLSIGLIVLYVIMAIIRQIIEPRLVAGQLGLPPFITIIGMFVGLKLFGFIGMLIIPIFTIMIKLLNDEGILHLWKNPVPAEGSETGGQTKPKKPFFLKKKAANKTAAEENEEEKSE